MMPAYDFTSDWFSHCIPLWEELLGRLAGKPELALLEIGSHEGRSGMWLHDHVLTQPSASIVCLDLWLEPAAERRFDANVVASGRSNQVRKIKSPSHRALPLLAEQSL